MDGLKFLVIFILLTVGVRGDDNREGRSVNHRRQYDNYRRRYISKRPITVRGNQDQQFRNNIGDEWQVKAMLPLYWKIENADRQVPPHEANASEQKHILSQAEAISSFWNDKNADWAMNQNDIQFQESDNSELPESPFGISPRLSISTNGRSLNFNKLKSFHDEDQFAHNNDDNDHILDEDLDHNRKSFRTSRSVRKLPGRPEQLAATLAGMQQGNLEGLQITTNQGAQLWNLGEITASGSHVVTGSSEESYVEGEGGTTSLGVVSVTRPGDSSRGKSTTGNSQTEQGINVGNSAHAGNHLEVIASGLEVSVNSSGSSGVSGTGTISSSGTTSVIAPGSSSGGWRSSQNGPQTYQGASANNGAQAGEHLDVAASGTGASFSSSGGSSVTGSGTISASGTTNVYTSGGNNGWGLE